MANRLAEVQPAGYAESVNGTENKKHGGLIHMSVRTTGVAPLLMNAMSQSELLAIYNKVKAAKNASRPEPRDHCEQRVHRLHNGDPCVPTNALYGCFINAGKFVRLDGKRQISTATSTILPGMMTLEDAELPLYTPGTDEPAKWEVDIQLGRNPNGGEAVAVIRPRFDAWELRFTVSVDQQQMPLKMAHELIQIAGQRVGLLDFRPQRKGTFGRFAVTLWEEAKDIS